MTLLEILGQVDALCPNAFPTEEKLRWLNGAEKELHTLLCRHGAAAGEFIPITRDSPWERTVLAPEEFADLYLLYLQAQMDHLNGETARYNNSMSRYWERFTALRNGLNRQQPEKTANFQYF